jgi:hypothetical protein
VSNTRARLPLVQDVPTSVVGSRRCIAEVKGELVVVEDGNDFDDAVAGLARPVAFVIVEGLVFKTTRVRHRAVGELFSACDVL